MNRTKKFQWMAVMVTAMVMTCMTMTSCSVDDNPVSDEDVPGGLFGSGRYKTLDDVAVGDFVFADGTIWTTRAYKHDRDWIEAVGVVVYVGQDAISENGVTLRDGKTKLQSHCLVLSIYNAVIDGIWSKNPFEVELGDGNLVNNTAALKDTTKVSGYMNTKTLVEKAAKKGDANFYPAAAKAWNYDDEYEAPASSTGWFLPSAQQWVHILAGNNGLGKLNIGNVVWNDWIYDFSKPGFLHKLDLACSSLDGWNWTSSEYDWRNAVCIYFGFVDDVSSAGFKYNNKGDLKCKVRPVFAM